DLSVDLLLRNRRRVLARLALRTALALLGLARLQCGVLRLKFLQFLPHWDQAIREHRTALDAQRLNVKLHCASSDSIPSRRDTWRQRRSALALQARAYHLHLANRSPAPAGSGSGSRQRSCSYELGRSGNLAVADKSYRRHRQADG